MMDIAARTVGDVVVFDVAGDFTRIESPLPTLHELVTAQLRSGKRRILFNLEKTRLVDSFGVGEIIASFYSIQKLGGGFKLCKVPGKLMLVLRIVGLVPGVIDVYDSEPDALESFASSPPSRGGPNVAP